MEYDKEEARRRRALEKAEAARAALEARLAEAKREARSAKARLLATTKSENWHRQALAWLDRDAGYTGEMASARVYLRNLPTVDYVAALAPFAEAMPQATNIAIEVAAVTANVVDWTEKGDELLLARARREYVVELAGFRRWQKENPDKASWREQPATRLQWFQISRNAARLGIDMPAGLNRGEAHDWIETHGGNLRLSTMEADDGVTGASDHPDHAPRTAEPMGDAAPHAGDPPNPDVGSLATVADVESPSENAHRTSQAARKPNDDNHRGLSIGDAQ